MSPTLRLSTALLASAALAACGTPSDNPDAGSNPPADAGQNATPDAGQNSTPDAGQDSTPDAGSNDTPDGGGQTELSWQTVSVLNANFSEQGSITPVGSQPANWVASTPFGTSYVVRDNIPDGDNSIPAARLVVTQNSALHLTTQAPVFSNLAAGTRFRARADVRMLVVPDPENPGDFTPPPEPATFQLQLVAVRSSGDGPVDFWESALVDAKPGSTWSEIETAFTTTAAMNGFDVYVRFFMRYGTGLGAAEVLVTNVRVDRAANQPVPLSGLVLNGGFEEPVIPAGEFSYGWYGWNFDYAPPYAGVVRHPDTLAPFPVEGSQALELHHTTTIYSQPVAFTAGQYYRVRMKYVRRADLTPGSAGGVTLQVVPVNDTTAIRTANAATGGATTWTDLTLNCFRPTELQTQVGLRIGIAVDFGGLRLLVDDVRVETMSAGECEA